MRSSQPDELDQILDEALASYSSEEPRPGLEQRVLNRVRAAGRPRRIGWWPWLVAVPAFASLLLLMIWHKPHGRPDQPEPRVASVQTPAPVVTARAIEPLPPPRRSRRVSSPRAARPPLPKGTVFPSPSPLSAEEMAWVELLTRFPDQAREVMIAASKVNTEPIEIQKIEIPPLRGGTDERQ